MDDFNKWMKIAEGDLPEQQVEIEEASCDCDSYDCETCHPLTEDELELALENFGSDLLSEEDDEDEEETEVDLDSEDDFDNDEEKLDENPALMALGTAAASAAGSELGNAAANKIFSNEEEPAGMGLRAEMGDDDKMYDMARNMGQEMIAKGMDPDQVVITLGQQFTLDDAEQAILYKELTDPEFGHQEGTPDSIDESDDVAKLISEIKYSQDMGVSNHPQRFDMAKVSVAGEDTVRKIHGLVCGTNETASAGAVAAGAVGGGTAQVQDPDGVYGSNKGRGYGSVSSSDGFGSDAGVGESSDEDASAELEAIKRMAGL